MEDIIAAAIGIVLMLAFAGGLAWMIGSPPLLIISLLVLAMAVIDVVRTLREQAATPDPDKSRGMAELAQRRWASRIGVVRATSSYPRFLSDIKTSGTLFGCMRTTLTLDPDVAALLERVRAARDATLKDVVNEGLRRGLKQMTQVAGSVPVTAPRRCPWAGA